MPIFRDALGKVKWLALWGSEEARSNRLPYCRLHLLAPIPLLPLEQISDPRGVWTQKPSAILLHTPEHQLHYTDSPNAEKEHPFLLFPSPLAMGKSYREQCLFSCSMGTVRSGYKRTLTELLLWTGHRTKHFARINSFNPPNNSMEYAGLILQKTKC